MSPLLLTLTGLAFALGLVISWVQTRRRIRRQVRERLVAEAERRLRAEILKRLQEKPDPGHHPKD